MPGNATAAAFGGIGHFITVGEQHRIAFRIGNNVRGKYRHHIRTIRIIGNASETFGFALGAVHTAGTVQAFQRGIGRRINAHGNFQYKFRRHRGNGQAFIAQLIILSIQQFAVQMNTQQLQPLPVQQQRCVRCCCAVAAERQPAVDPGMILMQIKFQFGGIEPVIRRAVILQINGLRLSITHNKFLLYSAMGQALKAT